MADAKALIAKLTTIEEAIYQTKLKSGQDPLNYPIRLNNKIAALLGQVESADSRPTVQQYEIFEELSAELVAERGLPATLVADEGGLGPRLPSNRAALELLAEAIERTGLEPGEEAAVAIDVAATQLLDGPRYRLETEGRLLERDELLAELASWCDAYPVVSLEDPLAEDDWEGWAKATRALGDRIQLVGDDLFVTNVTRLSRGIAEGIGNSILVKVNQIGSLTETLEAVRMAHRAAYTSVMSHRSGETEDTTIADLAVALGTGQIKTGSASRTDRICKYNQLLRIEEILGDTVVYGGTL